MRRTMRWVRRLVRGLAGLTIAGGLAQAQAYFYDEAGRLIRVAYPQGNGISYTYDAGDNLTGVSPINLPPAPTNFTASRAAGTSANLVWQDTSGNETGFVIMRRRAGDYLWETIATVAANTTS